MFDGKLGVPLTRHEGIGGTWCIAPLILNLGTRVQLYSPNVQPCRSSADYSTKSQTRSPGIDPRPVHVLTYWHMKSLNIT